MRSLRPAVAVGVLLSGIAAASAQAQIPANEMPGRERERFIESPLERFFKPGPFVQPKVVETPKSPRKKRTKPKPR